MILVPAPTGGPLTIYQVMDKEWLEVEHIPHNLVVYQAADILARLLTGDTDYAINTMYFEFTNGSAPTITPTRAGGQSYYDGLNGGSYDFVRVAIDSSPVYASSDEANYTGNISKITGLTAGTTGYFGHTFSQAAGSKVYGAALVASPTGAFSGDLVFARIYFGTAQNKVNGGQIGIRWPIQFP